MSHVLQRAARVLLGCALALSLPTFANDTVPEPTEVQIRAEYDRAHANWQARTAGQKEYEVRHILLATEAEAQAALVRIRGGEGFETVARAISRDPGSASKGGALGWSVPGNFVEPFAQAMTALGTSGMTAAPVKTAFGWHLIEVLGQRDATFPVYENMRERVRQALIRAASPWVTYDASGIWTREVNTQSILARGDRLFFQYRERSSYGQTPETMLRPIAAVVDCVRRERADITADGSFEMRTVYVGTAQERQMQLVCNRTVAQSLPQPAPAVSPADVGLRCDAPTPQYPVNLAADAGGLTVVVRGQLTAPAAQIGEVFVEAPSGNTAVDNAALAAFRTMRCSTATPLVQARWVRRSYVFKPESTVKP